MPRRRSGNLENYHRYQRFPIYPVGRPAGRPANRRSRRHSPVEATTAGRRRRWIGGKILRLLGARQDPRG